VGGTLIAKSAIFAVDSGYPAGYGFGFKQDQCLSSHVTESERACAYGNYLKPLDAGAGGATTAGGGVIHIQANNIELELSDSWDSWLNIGGETTAYEYRNRQRAAAGSALIETAKLSLINSRQLVQSNLSVEYEESLMSGRVAVFVGEIDIDQVDIDQGSDAPTMTSLSSGSQPSMSPSPVNQRAVAVLAQLDALAEQISVAGTIYLVHTATGVNSFVSGDLVVEDVVMPMSAKAGHGISSMQINETAATNMPAYPGVLHVISVGRHTIKEVESIAANRWRIGFNDPIWVDNVDRQRSALEGLTVRLSTWDGSVVAQAKIITINQDSLILASSLDLYQFDNGTLQGLHQFTQMSLGRNISFGQDLVEFESANIKPGTEIWAGTL